MRDSTHSDSTCSAATTTRIIENIGTIDANAWNALLAADGAGNVLLQHEFLHALGGCATADTGWAPRFLTLWSSELSPAPELIAAAPLYDKFHSYGEYVFDWAWADAYQRYGLAYYPKRLSAVPFSPVGGARLIARSPQARQALAAALLADAADAPSLHVLYPPPRDIETLKAHGLFVRLGVQFHWHNRGPEPYRNFDDFLAALAQPKRKKIRAERRKVLEAGVRLERKTGRDITAADWAFFFRCYRQTYAEHLSSPYLNLEFFERIGAALGEHVLLVIASRGSTRIAASLGLFDAPAPGARLYGRYWGALEPVPCLHFECCYYQMIEFAIERRLAVFEGGAQGAHKMARGLDPVTTYSAHWIADPRMREAIERHVAREREGVAQAIDELSERRAYVSRAPHVDTNA
jgi:predicted N-acyltransferase